MYGLEGILIPIAGLAATAGVQFLDRILNPPPIPRVPDSGHRGRIKSFIDRLLARTEVGPPEPKG
jgi:hypothetical protein